MQRHTDWRDLALDAMRVAMLVGAAVTLGWGPREQSFRLALTFFVVLVPRALAVPRLFDLAFVLAMSFQAWGNVFGAFDGIYGYDKVVHFLLPSATSALLYLLLVRLRALPDLASERSLHANVGIALVTLALGLTVGALYEIYEWFADTVLGGHLYTSYGDSIGDLVDDGMGSLLGGLLIVVWNARGWASRRPGAPSPTVRPRPDRASDRLAAATNRVIRRLASTGGDEERHVHPVPRAPRWLVGDWWGFLRDPADLVRAALAGGLLAAAVEGDARHATRFAVTLAITVLARRMDLPRLFELAFCAAMGLQAWGRFLGAFSSIGGYSVVVHVTVTASAACVLYLVLVRLRVVPDLGQRHHLHQRAAVSLVATSLGFSVGVVYEVVIFVADHVFAAGFAVTYSRLIAHLGLDFVGACGGAALMVVWSVFGWGTRRLPGSQLHRRQAARAA